MKLIELNEAIRPVKDITPEQFAAAIAKECSEIVKGYKDAQGTLYRGIKLPPGPAFLLNILKDRKPVQMDKVQHEYLHKAMLELGINSTRKNSIFCTTSPAIAKDWGPDLYHIFVRNGWEGLVYKEVQHGYAFEKLDKIAYSVLHTYDEPARLTGDAAISKIMHGIEDLDPFPFDTADTLEDVISTGYQDITITGSSYYALKRDSSITKKIFEILDLYP
jgi:hypothetical protein